MKTSSKSDDKSLIGRAIKAFLDLGTRVFVQDGNYKGTESEKYEAALSDLKKDRRLG